MFPKKLKTTADVLSAFTKTMTELESVIENHTAEAATQRDKATAAKAAAEVSEAEATQAASVLLKIRALVG
jgi:hypothetical protein